MFSVGGVIILAICYFMKWYVAAFIVVGFGLINGILGGIYAIVNPEWYEMKAYQAGAVPNYRFMIVSKIVLVGIMIAIEWNIARMAGYIT